LSKYKVYGSSAKPLICVGSAFWFVCHRGRNRLPPEFREYLDNLLLSSSSVCEYSSFLLLLRLALWNKIIAAWQNTDLNSAWQGYSTKKEKCCFTITLHAFLKKIYTSIRTMYYMFTFICFTENPFYMCGLHCTSSVDDVFPFLRLICTLYNTQRIIVIYVSVITWS